MANRASSVPALPTPTDPNQAAGAGAPAAAPANFQSIRDAAREYGYDFGQDVTDDRMALQKLIAQANANRQADYYAQVGQRLVPHAQQFQEYLAAKNQPQQPEGRKPWEAPPFDQRWASMVTQDPQTGIYLSKPGVPSEIGKAVNEYADWKQKFDENPASVINDMVKVRAREEAMAIYQEQNAIQQQQQAAQSIVNQNASWFYAQDQSGRRIMDQSGRPTPTPAGAAYLRHLGTVRSAGVTNPVQQDALARQLLAGEYAAMNVQRTTQQQQAAGFPAQQQIQQTNTNPLQALPPQQRAITQGATEPGQEGLSLFERLQKNFQAGGITDAAFLPENMGF